MNRFKVGVIGLGARAETFARSLHEGTERGELFGLCDIDEDRTKKFCDYCGMENVRCFSDPKEFFGQKEMDAVVITTPDFTHLDVARPAFEAGKHVYLEKPLDVSSERCREIIRLHRESNVTAFVGFNLRASRQRIKAREIVRSGVLGQIIHIEGLEQLNLTHSASFTRRFHRHEKQSGGLLNTKCCHDLDLLMWLVGHEHKVIKVASFGGTNIFLPKKAPAKTCHECPRDIYRNCPYKATAGFVFPVHGTDAIYKTRQTNVYGGDLCAYTDDKDLVDNQTLIFEWDNGVRGNFNLQLFQNTGKRETKVWGEKGLMTMNIDGQAVRVILSDTGETTDYTFQTQPGGHGGTDPKMLGRFFDAIEAGGRTNSNLGAGLAATLFAEKALESLKTGKVVEISPDEYACES